MSSRIIVSRDLWRGRAIGDGNESERPELATEIHRVAQNIAATWVQHTKAFGMVKAPVALRTYRYKLSRRPGYIEFAFMSATSRLIYPISGGYSFGIDAIGNLYDRMWRRNMDYTADIHYWAPMSDVAESRYSTAVLSGHLLPYLNNMASH